MTERNVGKTRFRALMQDVEEPPPCEFCGRCVLVGVCCEKAREQLAAEKPRTGILACPEAFDVSGGRRGG